ncbi:peptidase, M23 family [Leptospira inadai serovar Lyme str. 10]|uniref:Peptidase, M23 family n=2 Tax=Leptospira inadai serovar Lyme TaxID=293084 RepID=V6HCQ3_9LEPT|nr:M23 family metallopeptidase [Leptospira inadai]EQA37457.1 peptidase, M23 family [Leptospira inadai serovar Lyme str. 10]PNV74702.1 peptidase M23 [Leptospira inadai serovar Lyme]
MIFKKPRQLTAGKELLRTDNFTLIYLGSFHFHYSFYFKGNLYHGSVDFRRRKFRMIPAIASVLFVLFFLGIWMSPSNASMETKVDEISENDSEDLKAKKGDEKFLEESEKAKLTILMANEIRNPADKKKQLKVITYKVKRNESLSEIATRFKVSMESIAGSSNINLEETLYPGQILQIPNKQGLLYKVKAGDTIARVASLYKVNLDEILEENKLDDLDVLRPGQKVFLPGAVIPDPTPKWVVPVSSHIVTSNFGWRTFPQHKFHEALDLKANYEAVMAARNGKVIFAGWMGGYGNAIVLEHNDDFKTLYAHNSRLNVKRGDYVVGGKKIATSGCTGYCFGPHLHFEVIHKGKSVNPAKYLKGLAFKRGSKPNH